MSKPDDLLWMQQFRAAVIGGKKPDRRALIRIANGFAKYIAGAGSLDEAFGLTAVQRSGNAADIYARENERGRMCWEMREYLIANEKASRNQAAAHVIAQLDIKIDEDSLVRYFADWLREMKGRGADLKPSVARDTDPDWWRI